MASLGEYLRQARERRGVTLEDVARVTRIRRQHLEALEADRLDDLPAPPFVRGFLSAYAKQIGLVPDDVLARFQAAREASAQAGATPPSPARPQAGGPHSSPAREATASSAEAGGTWPLPARAEAGGPQSSPAREVPGAPHSSPHGSRSVLVLVALVGVGALAVVGSMLARPSAPPVRPIAAPMPVHTPAAADLAPSTETVATSASPDRAETPSPQAGATPPSPARAEAGGPQSSPARAATYSTQAGGTSPLPARTEAASSQAVAAAPVPARALPAAPQSSPVVAAVPARRSTLSVAATEEAWVQVTIDGGAPVEASLRPGDRVSWQGRSFEIVVGNAGGISLELDGVPQPPLGESGRRVTLRLPRPPVQ